MSVSPWAQERFGEVAAQLLALVPAAIAEAHADSVAAQISSGTSKRDPYGHTLKNRQHECLLAATADLPGVERFHLRGAPHELVRLATGVLLYPWRYATSTRKPRSAAKMRPSEIRQALLGGGIHPDRQLTIDEHAEVPDPELTAELADEAAILGQLRSLAPVVVVSYGSNPKALFAIGLADMELAEGGEVLWRHWEALPLPGGARRPVNTDDSVGPSASKPVWLRTVSSADVPKPPRFDDPPLDDDFGLSPRPTTEDAPLAEPQPPSDDTGTDDHAKDRRRP